MKEIVDIVGFVDKIVESFADPTNENAKWSESDHTGDPDRPAVYDDDSVHDTPNDDELDDPDGDNAFDMPLDVEGDGDTTTGGADSLDRDSTEEATDETEERAEETDEDEETDADEENEESVQDEEDYEDESDIQGGWEGEEEISADDLDDDLDYNEDELEVDSELDEQGDGGYRIDQEDFDNDFNDLFNELLADTDSADTDDPELGEETTELEEDGLIAGNDLFDSATDQQDDLLSFLTEDSELLPFDAAMQVGETELFDSASTLFDDMMGDALANYFASEEL